MLYTVYQPFAYLKKIHVNIFKIDLVIIFSGLYSCRLFMGKVDFSNRKWIFWHLFFLVVINYCYGIGNNVWKFQVSTMKILPVARIWSLASSAKWWLSTLVKGITSDNKLMNLCEIGLFHIVCGVSKATRDNYHWIWW